LARGSAQLARGQRRYRRKVASPKQWQAIRAEKMGACRVSLGVSEHVGVIVMHHVVTREDGGDDVADNLVPVCAWCHSRLHRRERGAAHNLLASLTDAEYAYMIARGGKSYPERAYGIECRR
jgi:hypothetical protein